MPNKLDRASEEERKAIVSFLVAAKTLVPALKVRFLERLPDQDQPFVRIGLALPAGMTATGSEAYELHQLASDISDTLPCHISVATSPITRGDTLLSMEGIVEQESMSLDAIAALPSGQVRYGRKVSTKALAIVVVAFSMLFGLVPWMYYSMKSARSDGNITLPTAAEAGSPPSMAESGKVLVSKRRAPEEISELKSTSPEEVSELRRISPEQVSELKSRSPEKVLELKRREFVQALDDYKQSLLQQPGDNDTAATKRLGTLQEIKNLVSKDSYFSGSDDSIEVKQYK